MYKFQLISRTKIKYLILASILGFGCHSDTSESIDKLVSKTLQVSDAALEQVGGINSEDAKNEFKKLNQYEYKVISFRMEISKDELEGSLSILGAAGYACSDPIVKEKEFFMICKRRPESLLRYIPQTLVGRP